MKHLFICGAPRSGTTAMWRYLAEDERVVLGVERYGNLFFKQKLTKDLFVKERFMNIQDGDTFYKNLEEFNSYYIGLGEKFESAELLGDKIPLLYNYLDGLLEEMPDAKIIIMLRNIIDLASSYEARASNEEDKTWSENKKTKEAIKDWRESLKAINKWTGDKRVKIVLYEDFYHGDFNLEALYDFVGLRLDDKAEQRYEEICARAKQLEVKRERKLDLESVRQICETAPFGLYREMLDVVRS